MKNPLITMSAITGAPTTDQITAYMKSLKLNGIEQVMLYPRSGCELSYLSEAWFDTIHKFLKAAVQEEMSIWIYDDFNWPSGHAGGRVTQKEQFRLKSITISGESIGRISSHVTLNGSLFDEKYFPDLLSDEAVDYFISCTQEQYYKRFGTYFGTVIRGFFTDEPSIGYCCDETSIPYYEGIEADYRNRYCRSFTEDLHHRDIHFCRNAYVLAADRFRRCYIEKLRSWCEDHHVLLTGHLMGDHSPLSAARNSGDFLRNLSAFSLPGIDEIDTDFTEPHLLALFGAAEYAANQNGAMAELFALGPCDMSYTTRRCMLYLASCFKINHYFLAISHMDLRGNAKIKDYFNDFAADQPDFGGIRLLAQDAQKATLYAGKDFIPALYLQYPTDLFTACTENGFDLSAFYRLLNTLSFYQIPWKFLRDPEEAGSIPVLTFCEHQEYCFDGITTSDAEVICSRITKNISVTAEDGSVPDGILVRRFTDGSCIVINLFGKAGFYRIDGKKYYLEEHGVFLSEEGNGSYDSCDQAKLLTVPFQLTYKNPNIIRTMCVSPGGSSVVDVQSDCGVTFAVRKEVTAFLNAQPLECEAPAALLSEGFQDLYRQSLQHLLTKGSHSLISDKELKYLPGVFLIGDFSAQTQAGEPYRITLQPRKKCYHCGDYFRDFGQVQFTATVTIPAGARALTIRGTRLYTIVYADENCLGERIRAPYIYHLDTASLPQTITLRIVQYSSLAPVFGDVAYYDDHADDVSWKGTPVPGASAFGFTEINWIF